MPSTCAPATLIRSKAIRMRYVKLISHERARRNPRDRDLSGEKVADIRDVTRLLLKRPLPGTVTQVAKPSAAPANGNTLPETGWVP